MKMKFNLVFLLALVLLATGSCKKKTDPPLGPAPEGFPISTALNSLAYTSTVNGTGSFEYGCRFAVTKPGRIIALGCKMPATGSYRVTLWNHAAQTVINQVTITTDGPQSQVFSAGLSIPLAVGTDYVITIFTTSTWNEIRKTGGGNIPYPLTQGSVIIKGFQWIAAPSVLPVLFPTNVATDYVAGISDIVFQPN